MKKLKDFVSQAREDVQKYKIEFILNTDRLVRKDYAVGNLRWKSIDYLTGDKDLVPNDKRGVYAFAICRENQMLPPHGYILYVGIAGRNSNRSLRARYGDYLSESKVLKRPKIARMIVDWERVLKFYFAPVDNDVTSEALQELEKQLNEALIPPLVEGDLDAKTKAKRRAFK